MKISVFWMSLSAAVMSAASLIVSIVALTNGGEKVSVERLIHVADQHAKIINENEAKRKGDLELIAQVIEKLEAKQNTTQTSIEAVAKVVDNKFAAINARLR